MSTYILSYMPPCGASRKFCGTVDAANENEAHALACAFGKFPEGDPEGYQARIMEWPLGHTVRSTNGGARLTYQPDWSFEQPWASYKNGTAGRLFHSLSAGVQQLTRDGYRFHKDATKAPDPT